MESYCGLSSTANSAYLGNWCFHIAYRLDSSDPDCVVLTGPSHLGGTEIRGYQYEAVNGQSCETANLQGKFTWDPNTGGQAPGWGDSSPTIFVKTQQVRVAMYDGIVVASGGAALRLQTEYAEQDGCTVGAASSGIPRTPVGSDMAAVTSTASAYDSGWEHLRFRAAICAVGNCVRWQRVRS